MDSQEQSDKKPFAKEFENPTDPPPQYTFQSYEYPSNSVIVTQPNTITTVPVPPQENKPHALLVTCIIASCLVFLLCCWPIGLVAFIFSVIAAASTKTEDAKTYIKVSAILNIIGVVIGIPLMIYVLYKYGIFGGDDQNQYGDRD